MQTADMGKEIVIRFRADEDDRRRLEQLAEHEGMTPSNLLRVLLLRASREHGLEPVTPTRGTSTPADLPAEPTPPPKPTRRK